MKDPFPPARSAAISSLAATRGYYTTGDISSRILPALCTLTVDKERSVRDQVFTTIKMFLGKMEKISEDPQAAAEQEKAESKSLLLIMSLYRTLILGIKICCDC
jgi:SCY1-like protein 1